MVCSNGYLVEDQTILNSNGNGNRDLDQKEPVQIPNEAKNQIEKVSDT